VTAAFPLNGEHEAEPGHGTIIRTGRTIPV